MSLDISLHLRARYDKVDFNRSVQKSTSVKKRSRKNNKDKKNFDVGAQNVYIFTNNLHFGIGTDIRILT